MTAVHEIVRLEPAEPFRLAEVNGVTRVVPSGTWRSACRCGTTTRARPARSLAAIDGVRHVIPFAEAEET
jgi:hypothetical protein